MKSVYSIIRYINNPLSNENIAFGLIAISEGLVTYRFSEEKINFITKLNPSVNELIDFSLDNIKDTLKVDPNVEDMLFKKDQTFSKEYLDRLSIYNNGIIQFDKPSMRD